MNFGRHSSGLLLLVLAAGIGALFVWLPPTLVEHYRTMVELGPVWGKLYLGTLAIGGLLLLGVGLWAVARLWRNTRAKRRQQEQRLRNPSELTLAEREAEVRENLSLGEELASGGEVPAEVRAEIRRSMAELSEKMEGQRLEIVAFGTISSGKSSLLNALAGRDIFRTDARGGTTITRSEIPWPGDDRVTLVDTPGLAEVQGERRAAESAAAAKDADLVLFVVDGPLKHYEMELLRQLGAMEKRVLVCLNKEDWYSPPDRAQLLEQIVAQVGSLVSAEDILAIQAGPACRRRVRVLADGSEVEETVATEADIEPLAERMLAVVRKRGPDLLMANLLLQSRGLVDAAKQRVRGALDQRAEEIVARYMWAAGGAAAINPIPLLDVAGGSAISAKMVLELARVYHQKIDADTVVQILANLTKNLIAMLGVNAATPAITTALASLLKTVPGVGTVAGGLLQGLTQALVTRWIGKVFIAYFGTGMTTPANGLAQLARDKWSEVTQPDQLLKLIQAGRERMRL